MPSHRRDQAQRRRRSTATTRSTAPSRRSSAARTASCSSPSAGARAAEFRRRAGRRTPTRARSSSSSARTTQGETWTKEPQLLFAHPRGGLQDPCLLQLDDNSLLCASYGWALIPPGGPRQKLKNPTAYDELRLHGRHDVPLATTAAQRWREIPLPPTQRRSVSRPVQQAAPRLQPRRDVPGQGRPRLLGRPRWRTPGDEAAPART